MLRRERLCPGPENCFEATLLPEGEPLDCDNCPVTALDVYLASPLGRKFQRALEVDFALHAGFTVTLDDLDTFEFGLLRLLADERRRYEKEEVDKQVEQARRRNYARR